MLSKEYACKGEQALPELGLNIAFGFMQMQAYNQHATK